MSSSSRPMQPGPGRRSQTASFTLLEVMIAMMIFFMAIFAILNLVAQNLRIARSLSLGEPDLGTVAAELFMEAATNRDMRGGFLSGDFGDLHPGAGWTAEVFLYATNSASRGAEGDPGLYQADITITWPQSHSAKERTTSIWMYLQ